MRRPETRVDASEKTAETININKIPNNQTYSPMGAFFAESSTASHAASATPVRASTHCQMRLARPAPTVRADRRPNFKHIARSPHRPQVDGTFRLGFHFFAQPPDVNVHATRRHKSVRTPHGVQQLIAR